MNNCVKCEKLLPDGAVFCPFCGKKQVTSERQKRHRSRANGTGSVYKRGNTWEAAVTVGYKIVNGKPRCVRRTKGGFRTKKEGLIYLETLRQNKSREAPTVNALWEDWKIGLYTKLSKSKQCAYRIAFDKLEAIQFCRIDLLTVGDLQRVINDKANTYYPARDIKSVLSHLYQLAIANQFVTVNLSDFIVLPELNAKERQAFTEDEIRLLWNDYAAGHIFTGYVLLMIYTGMMPAELLNARKDQIDWVGKTITGAGKKTKVRRDTPIVLADVIIPVLENLCNNCSGEKVIAINKDNFYAQFHETMTRAGCRDLTPYSCRHSTATALALDDIAPSVIQKVMRHAKFTTTQQYIHVDVAPMLDAVNKMADKRRVETTQQTTQ